MNLVMTRWMQAMVTAAAVLLYALTYVALNFTADLLYTRLNPKVRL